MKAILYVSQPEAQLMSQVLDRPYIQHVVEQLVRRGVDRIDLLLRASDKSAAALLGDGTRWGISIEGRLLAESPSRWDFAACCDCDEKGLAVFGDLGRLPALPELGDADPHTLKPAIYFHDENRSSRWTGWGLLPERDIPEFAATAVKHDNWRVALLECGVSVEKVFTEQPSLCVTTPRQVIESNRAALESEFSGLYFDGSERNSGVWIGRGAKVPATAILHAPCLIGEDAWIGEDCHVGPHAVIGRKCVVERDTRVCRSVVAEGTYLGPGLDVADSVVVRNKIHNVRLDADLEIDEPHVDSNLMQGPLLPTWLRVTLFTILIASVLLMVGRLGR